MISRTTLETMKVICNRKDECFNDDCIHKNPHIPLNETMEDCDTDICGYMGDLVSECIEVKDKKKAYIVRVSKPIYMEYEYHVRANNKEEAEQAVCSMTDGKEIGESGTIEWVDDVIESIEEEQ